MGNRQACTAEFSDKMEIMSKFSNPRKKLSSSETNWAITTMYTRIYRSCCRLGLGQKLDSAQTQPAQKPIMSDLSSGPAFLPSIANISLYQLVIEQSGKHFVAIYDFKIILFFLSYFQDDAREKHNSYLVFLVNWMSSPLVSHFLSFHYQRFENISKGTAIKRD